MERASITYPARGSIAVAGSGRHGAERLLLQVPVFLSVAFGAVYMVTRFIVVLGEDLKERPESLGAIALLAMMVGTVALLAVAVCAAVGASVGFFLQALVRWGRGE